MFRRAVQFGCTWEAAAITTGKIPTLTLVCKRYPSLRYLLLALIAAHLIGGWQS